MPACPGTAPHGPRALTGTGSTWTSLSGTRACSDRELASLQPRQGPALARHRLPVLPSTHQWALRIPSPGGSVSVHAYEPQSGERPQQRGPRYLPALSSVGTRTSVCDEQGSTRGMRCLEVKPNPCLSHSSLHAQLLVKTYQDKN